MIGGYRVELVRDAVPAEVLDLLPRAEERAHVAEVSGRSDTATLLTWAPSGALAGYAVIGQDNAGMVVLYAGRAMDGTGFVARAALAGIFGAAQVMGSPLRFHLDDLRGRLKAAARMIGAPHLATALDGDGIPMGVFDGL